MKTILPILLFITSSNVFSISTQINPPEKVHQEPQTGVSYRLLLGIYADSIPNKTLGYYMEIGGIKLVKNLDGTTSYYTSEFENKDNCKSTMKEYARIYGFKNMAIFVELEGEIISEEEFEERN